MAPKTQLINKHMHASHRTTPSSFSSRSLSPSGTIELNPWGTERMCFGPRIQVQIWRCIRAATRRCPAVTRQSTRRHLHHRVWHIGAHEGTSGSILS